jgi:hypothetical protein
MALCAALHHDSAMAVYAETEQKLCRLQYTMGRLEPCPEEGCPFWEPGGAVLEGRCVIEQLDVFRDPDVVSWLLSMRKELESARSQAEEAAARRRFHRLLDERTNA